MRSRMQGAARHKDRGSESEVTVMVSIKIIGSAGLKRMRPVNFQGLAP